MQMDLNTTNAEPSAVGQTVPGSWTVTSIVWLLVGVTTYILFNIGLTRKTKSQFPSVGLRAEFLSRIRVTIRNIREAEGLKNHLNEGYQKVKTNEFCLKYPMVVDMANRKIVHQTWQGICAPLLVERRYFDCTHRTRQCHRKRTRY